jgi:tRNA (guanine-N7-)-methyltransferase
MRRSKVRRWEENAGFECVHQPPVHEIAAGGTYMRGCWARDVLGTSGPLALELGCGSGAVSLALARRDPTRGVVGVDIKGHRFWIGAKAALAEDLTNIAFLRARIEYIDHYFGPAEVEEVWLTFSDPQPKDDKGTKRITSPVFLRRYGRLLTEDGRVHVKTDSPLVYERTRDEAAQAGFEVAVASEDVHGELVHTAPADLVELLAVQTRFEEKWRAGGARIRYLQLRRQLA